MYTLQQLQYICIPCRSYNAYVYPAAAIPRCDGAISLKDSQDATYARARAHTHTYTHTHTRKAAYIYIHIYRVYVYALYIHAY